MEDFLERPTPEKTDWLRSFTGSSTVAAERVHSGLHGGPVGQIKNEVGCSWSRTP